MLTRLQVNNYVLIDSLEIDFPKGLIIITGQTGAGKSILIGALGLVMGAKADASILSEGAENCESILVYGYLPESENYSVILPPEITGSTDGYILRADDEIVGQSVFTAALNDYCGKNYRFLYGEEKKALIEKSGAEKAYVSIPDVHTVVEMGGDGVTALVEEGIAFSPVYRLALRKTIKKGGVTTWLKLQKAN